MDKGWRLEKSPGDGASSQVSKLIILEAACCSLHDNSGVIPHNRIMDKGWRPEDRIVDKRWRLEKSPWDGASSQVSKHYSPGGCLLLTASRRIRI